MLNFRSSFFARRPVVTGALWLLWLAFSPWSSASGTGKQSYESCSLITSEYITVLQLVHRGFDRDELAASLPGLTPEAHKRMERLYTATEEEGLEETFSAVNSEYARCARSVYRSKGVPERTAREGHFYFCAGENKVRYEILMASVAGGQPQAIINQLADIHKPTARALLELHRNEGTLAVFDALGDELKFCINNNL